MSEREVGPGERVPATFLGWQIEVQALANWLIHHAARRAPPDLSQRLEEEWRADLAVRPSALSRLRFALGCCWATGVIVWENRPERDPKLKQALHDQHDTFCTNR